MKVDAIALTRDVDAQWKSVNVAEVNGSKVRVRARRDGPVALSRDESRTVLCHCWARVHRLRLLDGGTDSGATLERATDDETSCQSHTTRSPFGNRFDGRRYPYRRLSDQLRRPTSVALAGC